MKKISKVVRAYTWNDVLDEKIETDVMLPIGSSYRRLNRSISAIANSYYLSRKISDITERLWKSGKEDGQ